MNNIPEDTNRLIRVPPITIPAGIALFVGVMAISAAFFFLPEKYHESLLFFAAACAAAGQLALALYSARILQLTSNMQSEASRKSFEKEADTAKQHHFSAAARFGERWNDASMFHTRRQCSTLISKRHSPDDIRKEINSSPEAEANVRHLLNFFEELAMHILQARCDEVTAKNLFCGLSLTIWQCTEAWVREQRNATGRGKGWVQLEALYERWK
jgi:Domain of unknown function (DUF4760)